MQKSVALDKHNSDAWLKLGQVRAAKGEIDQAVDTAQQALQDNPRQTSLYIFMGKLYESKSDWKKAEAAYQSALSLTPRTPWPPTTLPD